MADVLETLEDDPFWFGEAGREASELLVGCWEDMQPGRQATLLRRILAGPPQDVSGEPGGERRWRLVRDWLLYRRLGSLSRRGAALGPDAEAELAAIVARSPPGSLVLPGEEPEAHVGLAQAGAGATSDESPDDRLAAAVPGGPDGGLGSREASWQTLCAADPVNALNGLSAGDAPAQASAAVLAPLLSAAGESEVAGLQEAIASFLLSQPGSFLDERVAVLAARWIWQRAERTPPGHGIPEGMLETWDRLADGLLVPEAPGAGPDDATLDEALNAPGGLLALALVAWAGPRTWGTGGGFGPEFSPRMRRLASAGALTGLHARLVLVRHLAFLYQVAPGWVTESLVARLAWVHRDARSLWRVRVGTPIGRPGLFNALKPGFVQATLAATDPARGSEGIAQAIVQVCRWRQHPDADAYELDAAEARSLLSRAPAAVRHGASRQLWRWLVGNRDEEVDHAGRWRREVGDAFGSIWPWDAAAQDGRTSRNLAMMATSAGDALPEAIEAVIDFIVPWEMSTVEGWLLPGSPRAAAERHAPSFLALLDRSLGSNPARIPADLGRVLDWALAAHAPIERASAYVRLDGLRRRSGG